MILCAVDGSAVPLTESEELKENYGCAKNQLPGLSNVTARICLLYGVLNGLTVRGLIHPFSVSEEEAVPECRRGWI
jgi:hypothetical protein